LQKKELPPAAFLPQKRIAARLGGNSKIANLLRAALAEPGSATGGFETVLLLLANPKTLVYQGFSAELSELNP
jgi:hypothetical protein